jgi:Stress-induced morphogen (activity unknown)
MKSLIDVVKEKIKKVIPDSNIEIIDNTHLHKHHKSFNKSKTHLKIIIQSDILKNLKRIDSHKKITDILKDEIETKIHSLEIKIL